jgi:antitoxin PrlF
MRVLDCELTNRFGKAAMSTPLTDQNQVTLPKHVRDALGLTPGSGVEFDLDEQGRVVIRKAEGNPEESRPDRFDRMRGRATVPWRTDDLMRLLRGDE